MTQILRAAVEAAVNSPYPQQTILRQYLPHLPAAPKRPSKDWIPRLSLIAGGGLPSFEVGPSDEDEDFPFRTLEDALRWADSLHDGGSLEDFCIGAYAWGDAGTSCVLAALFAVCADRTDSKTIGIGGIDPGYSYAAIVMADPTALETLDGFEEKDIDGLIDVLPIQPKPAIFVWDQDEEHFLGSYLTEEGARTVRALTQALLAMSCEAE